MNLQPVTKIEIPTHHTKTYPIYVEYGLTAWREGLLPVKAYEQTHSGYFLISEKGVPQQHRNHFLAKLPKHFGLVNKTETQGIILLKGGESCKNIKNLSPIYEYLIKRSVDRNSCLLAFGGGIIGDLTGFVASSILRGIDFIQIPTTLLAAVDASVGGKVGVNTKQGKNMVGAFHHPRLVYINLDFLQTLPQKEWTCGLAEMLKHGLIESSGQVLNNFLQNREHLHNPKAPELRQAIIESIQVKANIVNADEKESGLRSILNLGHTTAHALESLGKHSRFSHGASVSRGLVTSLLLSKQELGLASDYVDEILAKMEELQLPRNTAGYRAEHVYKHTAFDKKNQQGQSRFVLLKAPGQAIWNQAISLNAFSQAWREQKKRFG